MRAKRRACLQQRMAAQWRADHAGRSEGLQGGGAKAAGRTITDTRSSPRRRRVPAASASCRCSACWKAPVRKTGAGVGRDHPLRGRGDAPLLTPTAANISAIPISSKCRFERFSNPEYISARASPSIRNVRRPAPRFGPASLTAYESTETTHYTIVDAEGNAVAVTYTLNGGYGSGVTVAGLGFLLNNEMDDFAAKPGEPNMFGLIQGEANAIQPGKRPLSSMTPTIVTRDGKLVHGARRTRRSAHHHRGAAGDPERRRFRDECAGSRGLAALPSSVDARRAPMERGFSPDTVAL